MIRNERGGTTSTVLWVMAIIIVFIILSTAVGFACGWLKTGADIVSPENVTKQYREVIGQYKKMEAAAERACSAVKSASSPESKASPQFLEDPKLAYENAYTQLLPDYNRRQQNIFESELVGPKGYPRQAPTLEEMWAELGICSPAELERLRAERE